MSAAKRIPVQPWPITPEREALIRQAKATLDTPELIELVAAVPGVSGRVLAFERPPFLCNYAPIRSENIASIAAALRYILKKDEGTA